LFDQPVSLPIRAAIASLLGSLFGIALIVATHPAQAQTQQPAAAASANESVPSETTITHIADAALRSLRSVTEPIFASATPRPQGLRVGEPGAAPEGGLRWQVIGAPALRSEGDNPRGRDMIGLGMQVRF
jgi:hypothetical protein